jgi:hypothetical protein
MNEEFEMTDSGALTCFMGMKFVKTGKGMIMHQHKYALEIFDNWFEMNEYNSVSNPCETNSKLEECSDDDR